MIKRETIATQVRSVVEKNKLEKSFLPLLEEFFFRAADQYNWTDNDLKNAMNKFEKAFNIEFINLCINKLFYKHKDCNACMKINYRNDERSVFLDIDELKSILKFEQPIMKQFINNFMHEMGHLIQARMEYGQYYRRKNSFYYTGFKVDILDAETQEILFSKGTIANEYAEVINATRLTEGNISCDKYIGYEKIQNAGKVMLSSLGIEEMEFSDLQLKGRKPYENLIASKLGRVPYEMYLDSFEEILDSIYNFNRNPNQRKNLIAQIDALQILSKELFKERFENINLNSNEGLTELAKLTIDKENKDNALYMLFDEFNIKGSELQIDKEMDIHENLSRLGYSDEFLIEFYNNIETDEILKRQEQFDRQNEKQYDNQELMEKMYQSFLKYPIKKVPFKYRPSVILSKIIGLIKRKKLKKDYKLLTEGKTFKKQRTEFIHEMTDNIIAQNAIITNYSKSMDGKKTMDGDIDKYESFR